MSLLAWPARGPRSRNRHNQHKLEEQKRRWGVSHHPTPDKFENSKSNCIDICGKVQWRSQRTSAVQAKAKYCKSNSFWDWDFSFQSLFYSRGAAAKATQFQRAVSAEQHAQHAAPAAELRAVRYLRSAACPPGAGKRGKVDPPHCPVS